MANGQAQQDLLSFDSVNSSGKDDYGVNSVRDNDVNVDQSCTAKIGREMCKDDHKIVLRSQLDALQDGRGSDTSSDTEGPDTHSMISESSETEGPDSEPFLSESEDGSIRHDEINRGMIIHHGEMVAFVTDNLSEKIRMSSPVQSESRSSRSSSLASTPSMTRDTPTVDVTLLAGIEAEAKRVACSVDSMMKEIHRNLHTMSAVTVGCIQTYRDSVERTLNEVDTNIKLMYAFMARCDEINTAMQDLYPVARQIGDIQRLLDDFEQQLNLSGP